MAFPPPSSRKFSGTDRLARRVREMLSWRTGFDASGIQVRVVGDVVTLSGTVASVADAHEAARLARSVIGVGTVRDALAIR